VTSLLEAEDITKDFHIEGGLFRRRRGTVRALDRVTLALNAGDSVGLVGESGSGKTTLAKILTGLLSPDGGRVLWEGRPAADYSRAQWAGHVQMIFQDPSSSLNPKLTVRTLLTEALDVKHRRTEGRGGSTGTLRDEAGVLLSSVGLSPEFLRSYPHQLSGGQKQRVAIARALAAEPRVLVADEPVSALDLSIQAQILNLLLDLKDRYSLTLLVISHDLAVVGYLADRLIVMKEGRPVEEGPAGTVLDSPRHDYTRTLLAAVPGFIR